MRNEEEPILGKSDPLKGDHNGAVCAVQIRELPDIFPNTLQSTVGIASNLIAAISIKTNKN